MTCLVSRDAIRTSRCGMALAAVLLGWSAIGWADDAGADTPIEPPVAASQPAIPGLPEQPGDDTLQKFLPATPEKPEDELRGDALAWFMTAQLHVARGENNLAIAALKKAAEKEPDSLMPIRAIVPALLEEGETAEAKRLALEACKRRPDGVPLVQGITIFLARTNRIDEAAEMLKQAIELVPADRSLAAHLVLRRQAGAFERAAGRAENSFEHYRFVFEALTKPDERLTAKEITELTGDPGVLYDEFGEVFLLASQPDLALRAFDEAAKHRTSRPAIHSFNLALLFRQKKESAKALEELDKYFAAQLQTKGREAYQLLKDLLADLDKSSELVPRLEKLAAADPQNSSLAFFLADQYLADGNVEKAKTTYLAAPGGNRDPRAMVGLLAVYRKEKAFDALLATVTDAIRSIPLEMQPGVEGEVRDLSTRFQAELKGLTSDTEAMDGLLKQARDLKSAEPPRLDYPTAYVTGKLAVEAKRSDDALEFYKLAISMQNNPPSLLYREIAGHLIEVDRHKDAVALLDDGIQNPALEDEKWILQFLQSGAVEMLGETDRALGIIGEARKQQPKNPVLHYRQGWINYHAQRWQDAVSIFEEIIAGADRENIDKELLDTCRFSLSAIHVHLGEFDKGEKILEDVLKTDPENTQANNDLGYLWADRSKNLDQAKEMVAKALKAEPENAAYLDSMGWVLFRLGQFDEAKAHLVKATSLPRGEDATIWDHLGDTLEKLGQKEEAIDAWLKALANETGKPVKDEKLLKALKEKIPADRLPAPKDQAANGKTP